jgi:hypothetical protein|tara:strand:- start:29 stop:313 length:285 start_codon:yes stop_codon:yes gene_type:complete
MENELAETKAQMAAQAVGAWSRAVAEIIEIATGKSTEARPTSHRDRLATFDALQSLFREIKGQSVPEDESATGYQASTPCLAQWAQYCDRGDGE